MKLHNLIIENFRAIKRLELKQLGNMVVVAGANGCGKTQIYHAIRLLKPTYGGYQPNEYQQWWGEFNINRPNQDVYKIFGTKNHSITIRAEFVLTSGERKYLKDNAKELIENRIWHDVSPDSRHVYPTSGPAAAQIQRTYGEDVKKFAKRELAAFRNALRKRLLVAELNVEPSFAWHTEPNPALEFLFSTYEPEKLGVIDYHGAQRNYNREQLGGINLNIESTEQKFRQHALYNWQNKYSNVKSELAAAYVRDLLAREAGADPNAATSLINTMKELFNLFFPARNSRAHWRERMALWTFRSYLKTDRYTTLTN